MRNEELGMGEREETTDFTNKVSISILILIVILILIERLARRGLTEGGHSCPPPSNPFP